MRDVRSQWSISNPKVLMNVLARVNETVTSGGVLISEVSLEVISW